MEKIKEKKQFRFLIVGGANTVLDFGILFGLKFLGVNEIIANVASTGISFISSFILNKKYTFKSNHKDKKELIREMVLFSIVTLFGLWVIQSIVIHFTSPFLFSIFNNQTLSLLGAKIIATAFSLTWNYTLYNKIVFKEK